MVETARETIQVFHSDARGSLDFAITLTCTYSQEGDQWVGICDELGTSAFADTLDQARTETQEAVQLQLNEVERITDIRGYLAGNEVHTTVAFQRPYNTRRVLCSQQLWTIASPASP